jgi:hypothetical protein
MTGCASCFCSQDNPGRRDRIHRVRRNPSDPVGRAIDHLRWASADAMNTVTTRVFSPNTAQKRDAHSMTSSLSLCVPPPFTSYRGVRWRGFMPNSQRSAFTRRISSSYTARISSNASVLIMSHFNPVLRFHCQHAKPIQKEEPFLLSVCWCLGP